MPPGIAKPPAQRKRNRKRKRRAASSSSSSDSSDSSGSNSDSEQGAIKRRIPIAKIVPDAQASSSSESESSNSSSSSSSEDEVVNVAQPSRARPTGNGEQKPTRQLSPSPSPPPTDLPSFLPSKGGPEASKMKEQELKDRFRQFWMASVAEGFRDDLEEIRKEPNLGTSRLALLIDSLAAGADVFSSSTSSNTVNEMDVVLN